MRSFWWMYRIWTLVFIPIVLSTPVTNNFNASLRDYSDVETNSTNIKTLQKAAPTSSGRYANIAPVRDPVTFKDVPDNALSSSSHSRGLIQHEHPVYPYHDYDDHPHHGYGYDHDFGHYEPHDGHHDVHHVGYGHHHKHYDHGLITKALLWPIAGIALLGAAAALVSNPILLQLGVVSGRKRRDTEEVSDLDFKLDSLNEWSNKDSADKMGFEGQEISKSKDKAEFKRQEISKRMSKRGSKYTPEVIIKARPIPSNIRVTVDKTKQKYLDDNKLVRVPLKIKKN